MKNGTEKILRRLGEIIGIETTLKLNGTGSVALYPEGVKTLAKFCDGGDLQRISFRLEFKGESPSEMFEAAEKACGEVEKSGEDTAAFRVAEMPCFKPCSEAGVYIAGCAITADYIREAAEIEDNL